MIIDSETNFLYLADTLPKKFPLFYESLQSLLQIQEIEFALIPETKDIWAVDYMPIQVHNNKFIQFMYNPSYLKAKKYQKTISNVDQICKHLNYNIFKCDIILDGGNVVKWKNKIIMTDRVFIDNPQYRKKELIYKLYEIFEIDRIILIPEQPLDITGHADGMIRFLDEHNVIINDFAKEKDWFKSSLKIALHNAHLEYIEIPYNVYENKNDEDANGTYINYMQIEDSIFLPIFNLKEDEAAFKLFQKLFYNNKIVTVNCNEIAQKGGVLNCISWNIKI